MSTCLSFYKLLPENPTTMKIREIPRKSKVLGAPWIFFKCLESACFVGNIGTAKLFQEIPRCWNTLDIQEYSSSQNLEISRNSKVLFSAG